MKYLTSRSYLEMLEVTYSLVQQRGCKFANAVLEAGTLVAIKYKNFESSFDLQ